MSSIPGISDAHPYYEIDPTSREVIFVSGPSSIAVQFDHDSQVVTFKVPRMFDNIDHLGQTARIHYLNTSKKGDVVDAFSVQEDPEDGDYLLVEWLVSASATVSSGRLLVALEFCVKENNQFIYRWFTKPAKFNIDENIDVDDKAVGITTETEMRIQAAIQKLEALEIDTDTLQEAVDAIDRIELSLADKVDGGFVEEGYLYLTAGDEVVVGPLGPFSGTGGGGGGSSGGYLLSLKNLLDSRAVSAAGGSPIYLRFSYSSADEDGNDDGPGIGTVTVNGVKKATIIVAQGTNALDVQDYVASGSNTVKLKVENSEGSSRNLSYTVTVISLSLTTTMDEMASYSGDVTFNYTVTGSGDKMVHFLVDGSEIGCEDVTSSGRSRSYTIPAQSAGAHILSVYVEVTVDGAVVRSNTLTLGMLFVDDSMSSPAILSTFTADTATQGEILTIPWMVYDPQSETAAVTQSVLNPDGSVYSSKSITADRTAQSWVVQDYPAGNVVFRLSCGDVKLDLSVTVAESELNTDPVTDALALCFDPTGRSNQEASPESWTDGSVTATFQGVGFSGADGWLTDTDGASILRILPGGTMTIPFKLFESDARAGGATVEVEMATHNVRDYDTVVMSCLSGGRGFKIASQYAQITSEQSSLSMQFREDEKVRVSFVVEPRNLHRLIYVYVDGIMCGAIQYPTSDNFAQSPAVGITVGAESSGIDIYRIRLYTKGLTRQEVLDNYIADRPLLSDRMDAARRNDILDLAGNLVISKLPATLPYMILECGELPQYKGDKKTCNVTYVDPADPERSFTATVEIDVQGTSSAGYKKKNWKLKMKNGVTYTASGETASNYLLRSNSIPAKVFCMKADVASSEGANNVELVRLYNDLVPWQTPAQESDSRVRVGIDGLPCIIFWQGPDETRFWGKYNFNFDKGAEEVFGLTSGCESWEVLNNTSSRVLFQSDDFTGTAWQDDFEARYPDGNTDCTKLKALCQWVVSTDRSAVTSQTDKDARLKKFKDEFEDHFVKTPMLFYYLFTETFLMVDSRAKNFFPTTFDGVHWFPLPYDMDTAIGINNEGQLVFDYDLEDTDTVDGNKVFNGQDSVLWCNIRDAFADDLKAMYNALRSGTLFNYAEVVRRFTEHQEVWPEAVWNEDSWEKYLEPLENDNDGSYLAMLQGDKSSQRAWWLYNGFRYRDSKYQCGDAQSNFITLRCYQVGDITVTPYSHIWPRIKYGSYTVTQRGKRNVAATLLCPLDTMNDTEVYIYSADRLAAIGDLSPLQVGYANFSMAVKLQSLKLGDGASTYQNTRLTELYVGNNELLTSLDVRNCVNLTMTIDLSGCVGVETVQAKGSAITGVTLPTGGKVKTLELPGTVTNLTIRDQAQFTTLDMAGYGALTTLRLENTPNLPVETILNSASALDRVRLIGMTWTAESESTLRTSITRLESCIGMDASGSNTDAAVVTGRVSVPSISAELLTEINEHFPELVVVANGEPQYIVRYVDWDNTVLYRAVVSEGASAVNAVTTGYIEAPTREGTEDTGYAFKDFGTLPTDIRSNVTVVAQYVTTYRVRFMNGDTVYNTQWVESGGSATTPSGTPTKSSTAQYTYTFSKWDKSYTNITAPLDVNAVYTSTVRTYTVYFYNGSTLLQTVSNVAYGSSASYTGDTPVSPDGSAEDYPFEGWSPSPTNITGNTSCYAQFGSPLEVAEITDSWEEILVACADGSYATKYKVGNYKALDLGTEGTVNMQIAAKNADNLADGSGTAPLTWISMELLNTIHRMNPSVVTNYKYGEANGWGNYSNATSTSSNFYVSGVQKIAAAEEATWKLTFTAAADFTVQVPSQSISSSGSGFANDYEYEVTVNGETIYKNVGGTVSVAAATQKQIASGESVTILLRFKQDSNASLTAYKYISSGYLKFTDSEGTMTSLATCVYGSNSSSWTSSATITISKNQTGNTVDYYSEGTGSIGGWEKSEMRTYLNDTVKPLIPETVRNAIKTVHKNHPAYNTSASSFTQTTEDDVWLPSYTEMFASSGATNQPRYKALFPDNASRIKKKVGATSASWWWLRSAYYYSNFNNVNSDGSNNYYVAYTSGGVPLGFCT